LLQKVDEKGLLSRAEVRETMSALDEIRESSTVLPH
jgi:hypothetical protein